MAITGIAEAALASQQGYNSLLHSLSLDWIVIPVAVSLLVEWLVIAVVGTCMAAMGSKGVSQFIAQ
jgi:hypothetical protein